MIRYIVIILGIVFVAVAALAIDVQSRMPAHRSDTTPKQQSIFATGRIEGATAEIELRPQLAGRIVQVLVEEGQSVEVGAILLQLDNEQYRQEVALAGAELELAEAQLERILNGAHAQQRAEAAALLRAKQTEFQRTQLFSQRIDELSRANAVSQQEADNQRAAVAALGQEVEAAQARLQLLEAAARPDEVRIQKAHIEAAKARLELAKVQLERTNLRASRRGQILKIDAEAGELAGPTSVKPAIVMADTSRFYVRAFVEEIDAPRMQLAMTARITADGLPGKDLAGRVVRLSPRMSRKELWSDSPTERYDTKTREIWIELVGQEVLVVGLRVNVIIDTEAHATAPLESKTTAPGSRNKGTGSVTRTAGA